MTNPTSISFSKHPTYGKSPVMYGHYGNTLIPLLYFRKPAHLSQEQFEVLLDGLMAQIEGLREGVVDKLEIKEIK